MPMFFFVIYQRTGNSVTVCGGKERHQDILETEGNSVEVRILGKSNSEEQTHFLIEYEGLDTFELDTLL